MLTEETGPEVLERRATVRLLNHWLALRRTGPTPLFHDFDPARLPVDWQSCFLAACRDGAAEPVFDHLGAALWAERPAPSATAPALPEIIRPLLRDLPETLATGEALGKSGGWIAGDGSVLLYRAALLPFLDATLRPRYALGAVTWRRRAARGQRSAGQIRALA